MVTKFILGFTRDWLVVMLLIVWSMSFLGTFMDALPAILIFVPIIHPLAVEVGIHPVHLGVVVVMTQAFGLLTPPLGLSAMTACAVAGVSMTRIQKLLHIMMIPILIVCILCASLPWTVLIAAAAARSRLAVEEGPCMILVARPRYALRHRRPRHRRGEYRARAEAPGALRHRQPAAHQDPQDSGARRSCRWQAGAVGITCQKLGEVEVFADAGVADDILLTYNIVGEAQDRPAVPADQAPQAHGGRARQRGRGARPVGSRPHVTASTSAS